MIFSLSLCQSFPLWALSFSVEMTKCWESKSKLNQSGHNLFLGYSLPLPCSSGFLFPSLPFSLCTSRRCLSSASPAASVIGWGFKRDVQDVEQHSDPSLCFCSYVNVLKEPPFLFYDVVGEQKIPTQGRGGQKIRDEEDKKSIPETNKCWIAFSSWVVHTSTLCGSCRNSHCTLNGLCSCLPISNYWYHWDAEGSVIKLCLMCTIN